MHAVISGIIDADSFYEIHKDYAENIIVGFARLGGRSIGIIANQPLFLAGVLDVNSSKKAAPAYSQTEKSSLTTTPIDKLITARVFFSGKHF